MDFLMRLIKAIFGILAVVWSCLSCKQDFSVDLSNRNFVRLDKQAVSIAVGEKYLIKASLDTLGSVSRDLTWAILDPAVATVEAKDPHTAVITGQSEGTTVVKVESVDGSVKYFSDITVSGDRVIKVLAIGNSFSEDAVENYLYDLAKAAGHRVMIGNMYMDGCSLEGHWENASANREAYQFRTIASDGSFGSANNRTLQEVISGANWDFISFQEVSQLSGIMNGYQEYLPKLVDYVRALATNPDVKYALHQTWAYAQDANHDGFNNYDRDQLKMYHAIVETVGEAADFAGMDMVIPAGTAIQNGRTSYLGDKFTRDGHHLNLGIGRFTAASAWFEAIFGNVLDNIFVPEGFSEYDVRLARSAAAKAVDAPSEVTVLTDFLTAPPNDFELTKPIYIDFGEVEAGGMFNHFRHPSDLRLAGLKDADGANSNFVIEVAEPFTGTLDRGLQNALGWPTTVSQDMFFSDGIFIPQSSFVVSNLNKDQQYTFVFYGSINDNQTETEFRVIGKNNGIGYLDNDHNLDKLVVIADIEPADDATVTIRLAPGPNNNHFARFFGVNAMIILPAGMEVPVP